MMARQKRKQVEEEIQLDVDELVDENLVEASDDDEQEEELVEFQASGEASSVPDPIDTGSSRRKADKTNAMPMQKLGKTGVIANVVDAFAKMTPGQAATAYKGIMDSAGNKSSITTKGDAKSSIKLHAMGNMKSQVKEDIETLFSDQDNLNEEFFEKAATIFESALNVKATIVEEALIEEYEKKLEEEISAINEELETKLDDYLNYVADTWMEENQIAIEGALKVEMAESFMEGLKGIYETHNIQITEEEAEVLPRIEAERDELQSKLDEAAETEIEYNKAIMEASEKLAFHEKSSTLTLVQKDEFEDLVEGLDYENIDELHQKMDIILETYFNKSATSDTAVDESEPVDVDADVPQLTESTGPMAAYAQAISRTLRS
tara:strand:- start:606 stop:1739 length:1134 start_codon:yes stop_codon:yes gene_type:complete